MTYMAPSNSVLFTSTEVKTVANSETQTSLIGAGAGSLTLPANYMRAGKSLRMQLRGLYSTKALTPGNLTIRAKLGSVVLAEGTAEAVLGATAQGLQADLLVTCLSTGASGTVMVMGGVIYTIGVAVAPSTLGLQNGSTPVVVDTTAAQAFDLTAQWQTKNAANTISSMVVSLEALN